MRTYRMTRVLGSGGMGTVHEAIAEIAQGLTHTVAIKVAHPQFRATEAQELLLGEIETAVRLNHRHPNLVTVFGGGETPDGDLFLVMECIDGASASQLCQHGPLGATMVRRVAHDLLHALRFLHSHRVIHRDITASNILLGRNGRVMLTDFGLAKPLDTTNSGQFCGTAAYASPEQLGELELTCASDMFSLGAVLYRLLTGQRPFSDDSPIQMMQAIRAGAPALPDLPAPDLKRLISELMVFDPKKRPTAERALDYLVDTDEPLASDHEIGAVIDERPIKGPDGTGKAPDENSESDTRPALVGLEIGSSSKLIVRTPQRSSARSWPPWMIAIPTVVALLGLLMVSYVLGRGSRGEPAPGPSLQTVESPTDNAAREVAEQSAAASSSVLSVPSATTAPDSTRTPVGGTSSDEDTQPVAESWGIPDAEVPRGRESSGPPPRPTSEVEGAVRKRGRSPQTRQSAWVREGFRLDD